MVFVIYGYARFMTSCTKAVNRALKQKTLAPYGISEKAPHERGSGQRRRREEAKILRMRFASNNPVNVALEEKKKVFLVNNQPHTFF